MKTIPKHLRARVINLNIQKLQEFEDEMNAAKVDWQLVSYGGAVHSFTDPDANVPGKTQYDRRTSERAFRASAHELIDVPGLGRSTADAIVLEELARADVSSAILAQLIFNGPPRAIEHLGSEAMKQRWLPQAASGGPMWLPSWNSWPTASSSGRLPGGPE